MQRAWPCRAAGSPLLPGVGVSHGKLQNPLPSAQHKKHNRERSRTAVRTLRVYLTRCRSEDLISGETGHRAAADGSCAHGGQPLRSTFPLGLPHIHGQGRVCSNPTSSSWYSTGSARARVPTGSQDCWDGEQWLKLASHFPNYLSFSSRRDPTAAPLQAFPKSPQHFQSRLQPGSIPEFLGYPAQMSWKLKGRPLESEQEMYRVGGSSVGADAKIWHLRSQHHQKIFLTSPTQTLVLQGPSGNLCPSSVMGLSPSGNSPLELGNFFFLFCCSFLDEAFSVFPHVLVKPSFPDVCLDAHTSTNMLQERE